MSQQAQEKHALTMIPGPIEFDDEVLRAMSHYSVAHTAKPFVDTFSETLKLVRNLFLSKDPAAQPFVIAGSGTLGWDIVSSNLIEAGEKALVLNTGYFSDSFADCLRTYGADVTEVKCAVGDRPTLDQVETALKSNQYKIITVTHVDTSTGVLSDLEGIASVVKRVSPDTLIVVDGVCSVGVEDLKFDDWGLDFVLTASQKAIGAPAGLSITFASERAIKTVQNRKTPVASYFANLLRWLPIMQAYESQKPMYFATPAVQNVYSLHASLKQFATTTDAVVDRFNKHRAMSDKVKDTIEKEIGLKLVAKSRDMAAHGMSAIYLPDGVENSDILPYMLQHNVILAGGIHKQIATRYFRVGHMGVSVTNPALGHIDHTLRALADAFKRLRR